MTEIFLGLGSNIRPEHYLPRGLAELVELLGPLRQSPVYAGPAIGFEGAPFWNLVVGATTALSVGALQSALRQIEYAHGRAVDATRYSDRHLDIDILTYGSHTGVVDGVTLPRAEILERAFVLRPLAELAPDALHPQLGERYAYLWESFDQSLEPLTTVSL